ncbi:helix-turn-helix domain-containing protein [Flagellimonas nanhaiensis]|uniref:AraC family transcriptional regulator n=1 Tax=Flagellimonas nanhaiensis TaxID=2292706 RepID=A0A371JLA4_9FLAO|nr:AraC family transcriptional regulator [Allomuricauda nanhaiensis]RDY57737.1 AraC family transcriptional regulator [Allomuricauda nanhaiensis]
MMSFLQGIAAFNFLLFAGLIWYHRKKLDNSIHIFSFFLLGKGLTILSNLLMDNFRFADNSLLLSSGIILNSFLFFYAPFLYLFVINITKGDAPFKKHFLHFVPFFIFFLLNVILVSSLYAGIRNEWFNSVLYIRNTYLNLYFVQIISYTLISFWMVYTAEKRNTVPKKIVKWIKQVLAVFLAIWILFLVSSFPTISMMLSTALTISGMILLIVLSNVLLFLMLNSPEFFYNNLSVKLKKEPNSDVINKESYGRLCDLMVNEKLYKKADLKIGDLSQALGQSARNISILINTFYKGNFYDFVNFYRIEEAKALLKSGDENMTILAILYESGFNNKSVFNVVFKKMVGETPSSFRKNHIATLYG